MKALSGVEQKDRVSFIRDPEALACLLHELLDIATQSSGEILIEEIEHAARSLGYHGSLSGLRRILMDKGFVSEVEKRKRYYLQEINREAIEHFFSKHESLFSSRRMDAVDRAVLFDRDSIGGTKAEVMLLQVMRITGFMNEELHFLSRLDSETRSQLAFAEASCFMAHERVEWFQEQILLVSAEYESLGNNNRDIEVRRQRFILSLQADELYRALSAAASFACEREDELRKVTKERKRIKLLRSVREFYLKFSESLLKGEDDLTK